MKTNPAMDRLLTAALVGASLLIGPAAQAEYFGDASSPSPLRTRALQPYAGPMPPGIQSHRHGDEHYSYVGSDIAIKPSQRSKRQHNWVRHALIQKLRQRHSRTKLADNERGAGESPDRDISSSAPHSRKAADGIGNQVKPELPSSRDRSNRVIAADAEVIIFGPDRISIHLFRKGQRPTASAPRY
jgi:hypothetical protein